MGKFFKEKYKAGFTLIETLVSTAIFIIVSIALYAGFSNILKIMNIIRVREVMTNIANEQFEIVRNLPYQSVGTVGGIPAGIISQDQEVTKDNKTFVINTVVRSIDDPFDGTFDGTTRDLSPADMKLVEVNISCTQCNEHISPISFTTKVAPKNLEAASTNGSIVVKVFDSSGDPVSGADINIVNDLITPHIDLTDQTDIYGMLTIVDAPPSVNGYHITVSKDGYSSAQTYPVGGSGNPNPVNPDMTVVLQQISQISFTIDQTSEIDFSTIDNQCVSDPNFNFGMTGSKIIGTSPNVYKYSESLTTDNSGSLTLPNVEWDTYTISNTDSTSDIIGTNPPSSLGINPGTTQNMQIMTAPKNGRRLLVAILDQSTGLPVSDATVTLSNTSGYSSTMITNQGFLNQTDWSGGSGQSDYTVTNKFYSSDGNINYTSTPGSVSLSKSSRYASSGYLISSTLDTGSVSNFKQIIWTPVSQPSQTGTTSVRFQIATNNDKATWNFVGPGGTSSSYFTSSNQNINSVNNGNRYIRYKLYLSTSNTSYTPTISDISMIYTSSCTPPGQVSFAGLSSGTYTLSVSKTGYQSISRTVSISSNWSKQEFLISP